MTRSLHPQHDHVNAPAAVRMSWTDLLFIHWRVPVERIRGLIPHELLVDSFDGSAWIGLVPFSMTDCAFTGFGWMPGIRNFYECNVRTYVRANGCAGVWFFSLDAASLPAVLGGRVMWNLNYVYSRFAVTRHTGDHDAFTYELHRRPGPWPQSHTRIGWSVGEAMPQTREGSLEHFLTERYWLFTKKRGAIWAGRIHHDPWPLRHASLDALDDSLVDAAGLLLESGAGRSQPESVLASKRIDVVGEPMVRLSALQHEDASHPVLA